jgi:hypothetical protein
VRPARPPGKASAANARGETLDHLVVAKELKSLADRAFTNTEPPLDLVEINRTRGNVEQRVDLGDRARYAQNTSHPDKEIRELDLMRLQGLIRGAARTPSGRLF